MQLEPGQSALQHLYGAGHVLGLAAASWVIVHSLWRLRGAARAAAGCALIGGIHYALMAGDLEDFLARHANSPVPWHLLFTLISTAGFAAALVVGYLLARTRLRLLGVALGLALAVVNHLVLPLAYPGVHVMVAWLAALLIGSSALHWAIGLRVPRPVRAAAAAIGAFAMLAYVVAPGQVVRRALLGDSGAFMAPFVAELWARSGGEVHAALSPREALWFGPRHGLPPIAPERLKGAPRAPIVVLLTVDSLRSDVVEGPEASKETVPNLLAMAKRSLRFERVWAPAPYTMASLRSLFRGTYYSQNGSGPDRPKKGPKPIKVPSGPFLAEWLEQHGVTTTNLLTHAPLSRDRSVCRGFGEEKAIGKSAPSERVVKKVLQRLDAGAEGPLFIYSHIMDPHTPYTRGGKRGTAKERYLAEVSLVDAAVGKLRRELRRRKLHKKTYLIVTSDHGEAFGEHGRNFHGTTVYEEMIRVPLLIEGPRIKPRRVDRAVSLVDLGPTILSLFGVPTPGHFMGQSLVPFMRGKNPILSRPIAVDGGRGIRAMLFDERWKAIVDVQKGTEEFYDLTKDPGEQRNLVENPEARTYIAKLRAFFAP